MTDPLIVKVFHSVEEIGEAAWEELGSRVPFQSARWYRSGEKVMQGCEPVYLAVCQGEKPIARATFWVVRNEPLPVSPALYRRLKGFFQRWPLFICRSPLSNSSGLVLPEGPLGEQALALLAAEALRQARRHHCSFLIFDFLTEEESRKMHWPGGFVHAAGGEPGTRMTVEWPTFEAYVNSRDSRNRRRVAYNKRKAAEQAVEVKRSSEAGCLEESLELIRRVEAKYQSPANPWTRPMLEHMGMVESTFLEARIGRELAGCELLLYDRQAQLPTALGHAGEATYDYLEMLYTNIDDAIQKGCTLMRWGSGSYDIKRHLGFELEYTNHTVLCGAGFPLSWVTRLASIFAR